MYTGGYFFPGQCRMSLSRVQTFTKVQHLSKMKLIVITILPHVTDTWYDFSPSNLTQITRESNHFYCSPRATSSPSQLCEISLVFVPTIADGNITFSAEVLNAEHTVRSQSIFVS